MLSLLLNVAAPSSSPPAASSASSAPALPFAFSFSDASPFIALSVVSLGAFVFAPVAWRRVQPKTPLLARALYLACTVPSLCLAASTMGGAGAWSPGTVGVGWASLNALVWWSTPPPVKRTWQEQWGESHQDDDLLSPEQQAEAEAEFLQLQQLHAAEDARRWAQPPPPPSPLSDELASALTDVRGAGLSQSACTTISCMCAFAGATTFTHIAMPVRLTCAMVWLCAVMSASLDQTDRPKWKRLADCVAANSSIAVCMAGAVTVGRISLQALFRSVFG